MARVRGQATRTTFGVALVVLCLLLQHETVHAATHVVGGRHGWTFNVADWPTGKTFNAGDVLEFKYNPSFHNVVAVDFDGYNSCTAPSNVDGLVSGNDHVTLSPGTSYFICSRYDHCTLGMKIAVSAV